MYLLLCCTFLHDIYVHVHVYVQFHRYYCGMGACAHVACVVGGGDAMVAFEYIYCSAATEVQLTESETPLTSTDAPPTTLSDTVAPPAFTYVSH